MAKRARGSVRPGQRRPIERRPASPSSRPAGAAATPAAPRPAGLTDAETARAAELEAQLLAEERAAEQTRQRVRERASLPRENGGPLAVRAEEQYAYVARDVRDIVRIAAILLTILLALWIIVDIAKVVSIT